MPRNFGMYDHLNKEPLAVSITMDELVKLVEDCNYGTHRFLCALVRYRRLRTDIRSDSDSHMLTEAIANAIYNGGF